MYYILDIPRPEIIGLGAMDHGITVTYDFRIRDASFTFQVNYKDMSATSWSVAALVTWQGQYNVTGLIPGHYYQVALVVIIPSGFTAVSEVKGTFVGPDKCKHNYFIVIIPL